MSAPQPRDYSAHRSAVWNAAHSVLTAQVHTGFVEKDPVNLRYRLGVSATALAQQPR